LETRGPLFFGNLDLVHHTEQSMFYVWMLHVTLNGNFRYCCHIDVCVRAHLNIITNWVREDQFQSVNSDMKVGKADLK